MKQETQTDSYQKQAIDFLKLTNTTFKVEYKKHGLYFPDDKEGRDIYNVTLKNKKHSYTFTFGQSIANTGKSPDEYSVLACLTKYEPGTFENFCSDYGYLQLTYDEKFENLIKPRSENYRWVLKEQKARRIWIAVCKEWENLNKLFTSSEIALLSEIN